MLTFFRGPGCCAEELHFASKRTKLHWPVDAEKTANQQSENWNKPPLAQPHGPNLQQNCLFANAAFTRADELNEVVHFRTFGHFRFYAAERIGISESLAEQQFERLPESPLAWFGNPIPLQAYLVDKTRFGRIAISHHKWRHVLNDFGATADDRHFADPAELMNRCQPAHDSVIIHSHVARQRGDVGHDHSIPHLNIMGNVGVSQDMVVVTDFGNFTIAGTAMDGDVFTESVEAAYFGSRDSAFPFQVLRFQADAGEGENLVAFTQGRAAINHDMGMKRAILFENHMLANDAVGANFASLPDGRAFVDNRRGMNH